jgi:hypothetical protein
MRKIYFWLLLVFITWGVTGQTTLINPATDGGFENGSTFASNGWTAVNATTDGWAIGTTPVQATGANCAYVSADGGTSWTYSQFSTYTHVYKDFTVPVGENKIALNFKWKANGEGTTTSDYDNLKIYLAPTTYVPTTSAAVTGAIQLIGPGATSGMYKLNAGSWNNETINFLGIPGSSYRLIFQWKSDSSTIGNPPAALDDVSLIASAPGNFVSVNTGNWTTGATWDAGTVPTAGDNVTISTGHTVTIDAINQGAFNLTVDGILGYGTTPTIFNVLGNLNINSGGLLNVFSGTTGKTLTVAGNITNNGVIDVTIGSTSAGYLTLNGITPQTVSGTGNFGTGNIIRNLKLNNTSTAIPNIDWQFDNIVIQHGLDLSGSKVNLGTRTLYHGNATNTTTSSMSLTAPAGSGFLPGAKYGRWYTVGATGTGITAGSDPTSATSRFPFLSATGSTRAMYISRSSSTTTGNTAGYLTVRYTDATTLSTGLSIDDSGYTVTDRFDGNWTVTAESGYIYVSGTHSVAILANGVYLAANGNSRVLLASAAMGGTHQNGTTTPGVQRTGLTIEQLTAGPLYVGINSGDIPITSLTSGNWDQPTTWNGGIVPTCSNVVIILNGHTVTVNSAGNFAKNVTVNGGAGLTMNTGDLTVGCGANNFSLTNNGFLFVEGGTLTINGNLNIASSSAAFNQTGGTIIIDGNNAGDANTSVAASTSIVQFNSSTMSLTGGSIQIVDPHANATASNTLTYNNSSHFDISTNHTFIFGNGVSTDNGGNSTNGFRINTWAGSGRLSFGNLTLNTLAGTNRFVTNTYSFGINGNLTIAANSEFRDSSNSIYLNGNLANDGKYVGTGTLNLSSFSTAVNSPALNPQLISGSGTFDNFTSAPTASLTNFTINNSSIGGVTLQVPLSVSGTLTLTTGMVNTNSSSVLTLGTNAATATLTGGSATAYINGPFIKTIPSANSNSVYHLFPVGKTVYAPIWLAPTTTAVSKMKAETFDSNSGTVDASIITLSTTRRWEAPIVSGTVTNINVKLGDSGIGASNIPVQAPSASGIYTSAFGSVATYVAGTPNTTQSNTAVDVADYTGFISYAVSNACSGTPDPGATIASTSTICLGETVSLSLQNSTAGTGVTYQWKSSGDGTNYSDILSATNPTYSEIPQMATYYKCAVTCTNGNTTTESVPVHIVFTNNVATTTPGTRCGNGTVNLGATTTSGTLNWYAAATGGISLGTGTTFTTPNISSTTDYYVAAQSVSTGAGSIGNATTVTNSSSDVTVFNNYNSSYRMQTLYTAEELLASGLVAGDITALKYKVSTMGDAATNANFIVKIGTTSLTTLTTSFQDTSSYTLVYPAATYTHVVGENTISFTTPYAWDGTSNIVIDISQSGANAWANAQTYYTATTTNKVAWATNGGSTATLSLKRPNITFYGQVGCSSPRVAVTATVTPPPALTLNTTSGTICEGESTPLITITSGASDYDTYAWTPSTGVTGDATSGWIFNPTVTTTYVLNASNSVSGCATSINGMVTVVSNPSALTVNPDPATICVDQILTLQASGGTVAGFTAFSEDFNAVSNSWTTVNNSTGGTPADAAWTLRPDGYAYTDPSPDPTFHSNDNTQFYLTNSDDQGSGGTTDTHLVSPSIDLSLYSSAQLKFWHYYRYFSGDNTKVEVSTDNGNSWISVKSYNATQGSAVTVGSAYNVTFVQESIDLSTYAGQADVKIRFNYHGSYAYYWAIDNVSITGAKQQDITWSPVTDLYTDAVATTAYVDGTPAAKVYFKSTVVGGPFNYTVTATNPTTGCDISTSVGVTVQPNTTIELFESDDTQTICLTQAISPIEYNVINGTGASVTGLPAGLNGVYNAGVFTINGTPTETGTFNFSVTGTGTCAPSSALNGTIEITPNAGISLTSGDTNQTVFNGTAITDIVYTITNGTGAVITGLPNGVNGNYNAGVFTISGIPTESGVFNYTVYGNGLCYSSSDLTGTITVTSCEIGWANLQWPGTGTINNCDSYTVYAQVWKDGVTNAPGAGVGISAWIGISTTNTDPSTWPESQWEVATYNVDSGNNDEFMYTFSNLPVSNFYIASRFKYDCGSYYYGAFNAGGGGAWDGTNNVNATVTVNAIAPPTGDATQAFCNAGTVADLIAVGDNLKWYDAATLGNELTLSTALVNGTHYFASQTVAGCESTTRLDVTAVVNITAAPMSVAAKWTYEPVQGTNINPTPNIGIGTSTLVGSMTGAGTATGMNTATGCGTQTSGTTAWAIGTANPGTINESSGAQWNVSTVGLSNVKLAWEQRFSNTATNTLRLQYTTDGSTWNNFEMTESNTSYCLGTLNNGRFETDITGDSYRRINVDLSAITDANNNPNFGWRVVAAHYQNTGEFRRVTVPTTISTGGTWRFDNVTLSGSSTQTFCEGATVANLVATGTALKWYAEATGGTELVATEVLTTGTYYASQTLNACESQTRLAVQVVINPNTTIALTSGDVNQTVMNGTDITDIVYTITNGTGATVTGLPNGVIATYLAGTLTISGAPTENGTFNYSIYGTGTCASSSVLNGTITVNDCVIGWANLQWPGNGTINTCNPYGVYAQIWIDGVTNAPGAGDNITAWIGLSTENTDPSTWIETIWYPASFNVQVGNNDEFWYEFDNLPAGTYYIASRFKYACSPYYYGGFQGGAWNGTSNVNAQLTVNAIAMPTGNTTQYMCSTSPFTTLNDLNVVAGGTLIWYDAAIGGNVLPGTTTMIAGTTYYAANQQDGCESARLAVLVQEDCSLAIDPETEMIRMYPNPTADFLNLVSETGIKEVEVFNQLGQKVQVTLLTPEKLDVTQLAIGTYVIRLTLMNGNISTDIFIKK